MICLISNRFESKPINHNQAEPGSSLTVKSGKIARLKPIVRKLTCLIKKARDAKALTGYARNLNFMNKLST